MFRSATFKLTAWYLALVMAISLIFSGILYDQTTGELSRGLSRETERISQQFPVFQNSPLLQPRPDLNDARHRILLRLAAFNGLVFVGAGFASFWLARRTLEPIEEAHEQQKRFTADVSHELRTPLTAIRMESEVALINEQVGKQELRETLKSNLEETSKLESLINNLLKLTRLEAEELQQNFEVLEGSDVVKEAVSQVTKLAEVKEIKLDNQTTKFKLYGDRDALVQLLVILLDNSIKYSPDKSSVTVKANVHDNQTLISIIDQGAGIERQDLDHVFDRFYRAENSRLKQGKEGYGLGLSIAKMIIDRHEGHISLTSRKGHGTTAKINLPLPT